MRLRFERRSSPYSVRVTSRRIVRVLGVEVPVSRWHTFDLRDGYFYRTLLGRVKEAHAR